MSDNSRIRLDDLFEGLDDEEIVGVALIAKSGKVRVWASDQIVQDASYAWLGRQIEACGKVAEGMGQEETPPNFGEATPRTRH